MTAVPGDVLHTSWISSNNKVILILTQFSLMFFLIEFGIIFCINGIYGKLENNNGIPIWNDLWD